MSVRILLVDNHNLVSEGITRIINSDNTYQITQLTNSSEAIEYLRNNKVQIVIIETNSLGQYGVALIKKIKNIVSGIKVIGLSMTGDYQLIYKMLENGSDGYILSNTSCDDLLAALQQIRNGEIYLNPEVQQILIKGMRDNKNIPPLTKKEIEVLHFISKGFTNKEIAIKMDIGEETVKTHRKNIMSKFDIHNTAELVRFAIDHKLI